ncbi:hypothetical protein [Marinoscillum furvescens]|uniref:Lipopolysaccharide assembly protein A domain-containing protein n=1 Tax=Marinoscillum furvescens DSM 4134 TaxID=1122208 RepID=A0A3D9L2H3_MARFU|nr:hypothetical protein [Marinoscillum furvescens]RED98918.1 hypothetical protein C7460_109110 [Marinoscillum furvescens DSM 4134]
MRKFKLFFYPIYLIAAFLILYFSIDILNNMEAYKAKLDMTFALRQLPLYLMGTFIFLAVLMLVELVAENFQIISLKRKVKKAQEEVLHYKAKLYDQAEAGASDEDDEEDEEDEEDEADDDDDDK